MKKSSLLLLSISCLAISSFSLGEAQAKATPKQTHCSTKCPFQKDATDEQKAAQKTCYSDCIKECTANCPLPTPLPKKASADQKAAYADQTAKYKACLDGGCAAPAGDTPAQ